MVQTAGLGKELVHVAARDRAAQTLERAVPGNLLCRFKKTGPRGAGECAPDTDSPNAHTLEIRDGGEVGADEDVDRLRRNSVDEGFDVGQTAESCRVETVGAGFTVRLQATEGLAEIRPALNEVF